MAVADNYTAGPLRHRSFQSGGVSPNQKNSVRPFFDEFAPKLSVNKTIYGKFGSQLGWLRGSDIQKIGAVTHRKPESLLCRKNLGFGPTTPQGLDAAV